MNSVTVLERIAAVGRLAVALATATACGGPQGGAGDVPEPTPTEWRQCAVSEDCVLIQEGASRCCVTRFRAVSRAFQEQAGQMYTDSRTPPELTCVDECEAPRVECEGGRCVAYPGVEP